jgi:hypothetical protein
MFGDDSIQVDLKRALAGGALAAAVTLIGMWLSGLASGSDVTVLLRDFIPNAQAFTDTIVLASATILALMLTLLGMSSGSDSQLKAAHYVRIKQIAFGDTVVFVAALTVGLLLNVPLDESSKMSGTLEAVTYYGALGLSALLGGALVAIVLMIYNTVTDMIDVLALDREDHPLYDTGSADGESAESDAEAAEAEKAETS